MLAVCAIIIGVTSVVLDVEGGNKNEAEWAEYEKNLPVIDSLYDAGVPDSIIGELYPQPIIRQGGFATIFGGAFAFLILIHMHRLLHRVYPKDLANPMQYRQQMLSVRATSTSCGVWTPR